MELLTIDNRMRSGEIQSASPEGSSVTDYITLQAVLTIMNIVQEIRESRYYQKGIVHSLVGDIKLEVQALRRWVRCKSSHTQRGETSFYVCT